MGWPFRRHRGSQSEAPTPTYEVPAESCDGCKRNDAAFFAAGSAVDLDPVTHIRAITTARYGPRDAKPEPHTARQVIAASLTRDPDLAARPDHLQALVDDILLDLDDNKLEIVVKEFDYKRARQFTPVTAAMRERAHHILDEAAAMMGMPEREVESDAEVLGRARPDRPTGW